MSSHSGTIGRARGQSVGSNGGGGGPPSSSAAGNSNLMRRQRSVEWHHDRHHGYSSNEDMPGVLTGGGGGTTAAVARGTINPGFDSQLLAQLIAQSQQLSSKCECAGVFSLRR